MKLSFISKVLTLAIVMVSASAYYDEEVSLKRVRYCISPTLNDGNMCHFGETPDFFKAWKNNNVDKNAQKSTYIAMLNTVPKSKVESVIFISAGQQSEPNLGTYGDGYPNVLTGQFDNYKNFCKGKTVSCVKGINKDGLALRLKRSGLFDMSTTLFVLVFDARINWEKPANERQNIENAYWDFLTDKFDPGVVRRIILAGQSRGGCLSFRLAKRFRSNSLYQSIPLILQGYDPVCHPTELGTNTATGQYSRNPENANYKSIMIDMDQVFPGVTAKKNLAILNIHAGQRVLGATDIRSFTYLSGPQIDLFGGIDLGWWNQKWVNYSHTQMGGDYNIIHDTTDVGYAHITRWVNTFNNYAPPGPVDVPSLANCPLRFPIKVGDHKGKPVCRAQLVDRIQPAKCSDRKSPGMLWQGYCIWGKSGYWHARTLNKPSGGGSDPGGLKCSLQFPRRIGTHKGKPVCKALLVNKITPKNCSKKGGMQWREHCLWGKKYLWHARPLK